ncbi:unnamed protein product [Dicrocoelium dendriticum]|nr:unnamed protein product [Dicrocoelium dendriticum]
MAAHVQPCITNGESDIDSIDAAHLLEKHKETVHKDTVSNSNTSVRAERTTSFKKICDENDLETDANQTNLIVNYLPPSMSQEEMRSLFSTVGNISSCKLIRDRTSGQSLGYGFVNYTSPKDATRAIKLLNRTRVQNKIIKVSLARPSCESIKGANLYICGLPKTMTEKELEKLFQQCGNIITSRILRDSSTNQSKGVGFIRFDQRHEAELAIQQFNGYRVNGSTEMPLVVKFANLPTSIKAASMLCSTRDQGSITGDPVISRLSSLIDFSPFGIEAPTLPNVLTGPSLLKEPGAEIFDLLNATQYARGSSLIDSSGGPISASNTNTLRRVGGPVHSYETHRLRFNPFDGCAVQVAVNPFERPKVQQIKELTSVPTAPTGFRLASKYQEEFQNSMNAAVALAAASVPQATSTNTQHIVAANALGTRIPGLAGLESPQWLTRFPGAPVGTIGPACTNGTAFNDLLQTQDRLQNAVSQFSLMVPTDSSYMSFGASLAATNDSVPDFLSAITNSDAIYGAIGRTSLQSMAIEQLPINPFPLQSSQVSVLGTPMHSAGALVRVDGLSCSTHESIVARLFSPFPGVLSVHIVPATTTNTLHKQKAYENLGSSSCSAFVIMSDAEQAKLASQYLNGCTLQNRLLQVVWEPISPAAQCLSTELLSKLTYPQFAVSHMQQGAATN